MQSPVISSEQGHRFGSVFSRFILKTGLVLFLTVDICTGFLYLLYSRNFPWVELIPSALAVFSGLTAGILTRVFFRKIAKIIQLFIACIVITMTLSLAGLIIQEWIHIDLTGIWFALVKPDFVILNGIGWITALLAIFAWQRKHNPTSVNPPTPITNIAHPQFEEAQVAISPRKTSKTRKLTSTRKRSFFLIPQGLGKRYFQRKFWQRWLRENRIIISQSFQKFARNGLTTIASFFNQIVEKRLHFARTSSRMVAQTTSLRTAPPVLSPTPLPRKRLGRKMRNSIRLVGREEMRCPYCLQVVERNDPHGIVVCPICKSAHHKECWDITCSCQVPHNHAVL
ncbi:MAG: hypothetical protein WCG34_07530 [Leptolinea sp.]